MFEACGSNILGNTGSDTFCVSGRFQTKLLEVMDAFEDKESAKRFDALPPMILGIIQPAREWELMNGSYCWEANRNTDAPCSLIEIKI